MFDRRTELLIAAQTLLSILDEKQLDYEVKRLRDNRRWKEIRRIMITAIVKGGKTDQLKARLLIKRGYSDIIPANKFMVYYLWYRHDVDRKMAGR